MSKLTPYNDRYCPIFKDNIDGELCYEVAMCMQGFFKITSVSEHTKIVLPLDEARKICNKCKYADME